MPDGMRWIRKHASLKIAASKPAAACLFGPRWRSDSSTSIVYCGLDFATFQAPVDRAAVRNELGFLPSDFVIGHVGNFLPPKNHDLLLQILAEVTKLKPEARLLLIGRGTLEESIRATAIRLGIVHQIRFAGSRSDVARLMLGAMDVFVMPSRLEGLGLAAVEAQAAGLTTVLSDNIPEEVDIDCGLVHVVPLADPASVWARRILQYAQQTRMHQSDALARVNGSRFNIQRSIGELCRLYA